MNEKNNIDKEYKCLFCGGYLILNREGTMVNLKTGDSIYIYICKECNQAFALDNDNNESNKSNQVVVNYKDHTSPAKPVGVTALTGSKKDEINLSWTVNTENDLLGYNIYSATQGGGNFIFISSQSENNYTVRNLTPGNNYFLKVTALDNSNNESEYSDEVICKAKGDNVAPETPTNFLALPGTVGKVNLSWSANTEPDLTKYMIYQLSGSSYSAINETLDTTYEVTGLTSSTYCYFKISAVDDSDNESSLSSWALVIVP